MTRAAQTLLCVMTFEGGLNYLLGTQPLPFRVVFPSDTEGDGDEKKDDSNESGHSSGERVTREFDNTKKGRKSKNSGVFSRVTEWRGVTVKPGKSVLKKGKPKSDDDDDNKKAEDDYLKGSFSESNKFSHYLEERQYSPIDHPDDYYLAVFNLNQFISTTSVTTTTNL